MNNRGFSEEDIELILLRLVLIGDVNNIKLYSQSINKEKLIVLMKSLIISQPPSIYIPNKTVPTPLNIRWIASRILLKENYKNFPTLNYQNLALIDFYNMNDAATQFFKFALSRVENRPLEESKIISFAESYLQFYWKRPTLADFMLKQYTDYIIQVPLNKLFANFQFRFFSLINNLDKIDLNTLNVSFANYNDFQPFKDLFYVHRGYLNDDFFQTFQRLIINDKIFPSTIGYDPDRLIRSLINTSIIKRTHFVEILREFSYSLFKEGKIDESIDKTRIVIKDIEAWIFLSHHYFTIKNLSPESLPISIEDSIRYFQSMTYKKFENSENSIAADFLNRLQNDNAFFDMIRQNTGQTINGALLRDHSIPYFFIIFLKMADPLPFQNLNDTHLFCINDKDRLVDADFVWSYFAEVVTINALTKPDEAEEMIAQAGWYLSQINDPKIRHDALVDIFSLLFLETKEGKKKFVCFQSVAEFILTMILDTSDDQTLLKFAQNGHFLVQFAKTISSGVDFEDLIFPKEQQLLKALQNEDWLISDNIASLNSSLSELNLLYKTVNEYLKKSNFLDLLSKKADSFVSFHFDPSKSKSKFAVVEIGLSFPDQIESLKIAPEVSNLLSESIELLNKRYERLLKRSKKENGKRVNDYISLLKAVKTLNPESWQIICSNFSNLDAETWNLSPLDNDKKNLHLLKTFLEYLDSFVGIVLNKEKLVSNIREALIEDPSSFINKLFVKGAIGSAEKLSDAIKRDMMLMLVSEKSASDDMIIQVASENVPFALTLSLTKDDGTSKNPISKHDSIAFKIANIALKENPKRKEQVDILFNGRNCEESKQPESELKELKEMFDKKMIDIEKVTDISYKLDVETFSDFVMGYIDKDNYYLKMIIGIAESCGSVSGKLYDSAMLLKKFFNSEIKIYPLENLFDYLLRERKYKDATNFFHLFCDKIDNYLTHLIDAYLMEMGNPFYQSKIVNISPKDRFEIESKSIGPPVNECIEPDEDDTYFDDLYSIEMKSKSNIDVDFDEDIYQILLFYTECDLLTYCYVLKKSLRLLKNINKVVEFSLGLFIESISQIEVKSIDDEDEAWEILNEIHLIFEKSVISNPQLNEENRVKVNKFMKEIGMMKIIVDHSPFNLFKCQYDFFNFGKNLSSIFTKIDLSDSLLKYHELFNIPKSEIKVDKYVFECCELGLTDFQLPFPIESSQQVQVESAEYHCDRSLYENLSNLLSCENFFEPSLITTFQANFPPTESMKNLLINRETSTVDRRKSINKSSSSIELSDQENKGPLVSSSLPSLLVAGTVSNDHFYLRIKAIIKGRRGDPDLEPLEKVQDFFKRNSPIDIVLSCLAKKDLQSSIQLLTEKENEYDQQYLEELFESCIFEKVILRSNIRVLLNNVSTINKDFLLSVLKRAGPYLKFDIYSFVKDWRQAYLAAVELFCSNLSDNEEGKLRSLNFLVWMENCLAKMDESDEKTLWGICVSLQNEICRFAIDNKLECNFCEINIFGSDLFKENVVIFLLTHFNIKMAIAVLRFFQLKYYKIADKFCDIFINESTENTKKFFENFQKETDIYIFKEMFYAICLRMKYIHDIDPSMMLFYINIVADKAFRRKLLYQFNFLNEAFELAVADDDLELIIMIANDAFLAQKSFLLLKCTRFIEKKSNKK